MCFEWIKIEILYSYCSMLLTVIEKICAGSLNPSSITFLMQPFCLLIQPIILDINTLASNTSVSKIFRLCADGTLWRVRFAVMATSFLRSASGYRS